MEYVYTFSNFNRLGIKNKFSPLLRIWYLLRHHNTEKYGGNGWLSREEALSVMSDIYQENRPRELLKLGLGSWWEEDGIGYRIFGISTISKILNELPGDRVLMPIEAFSSLRKFRAYSYSTFFARASSVYGYEQGKEISRKALKELFGISVPTQIKYEKISGMDVSRQIAYEKIPRFDGNTEQCISEESAIKIHRKNMTHNSWLADIDGDGIKDVVWQIRNNYFVDSVFYITNQNKRVRRVGGSDQRYGASRKSHKQSYFDHIKQFQNKQKNNNSMEFGYVRDTQASSKKGGTVYKKVKS